MQHIWWTCICNSSVRNRHQIHEFSLRRRWSYASSMSTARLCSFEAAAFIDGLMAVVRLLSDWISFWKYVRFSYLVIRTPGVPAGVKDLHISISWLNFHDGNRTSPLGTQWWLNLGVPLIWRILPLASRRLLCAGEEGEMVVIVLCQRRYRCNCAIVIACDPHVGDSSIEYNIRCLRSMMHLFHMVFVDLWDMQQMWYDDRYVMRICMLSETFRDGHYSPRCFAGYWVWVETASCRWV